MLEKKAQLFRMEMKEHICPSGLKAKAMLEKNGVSFEDHKLTSRKEVDAFKAKHNVETTPQIWVDGKRIGGFDALKTHFGGTDDTKDTVTYQPIIALFAVTALMALATSFAAYGSIFRLQAVEWFISFSMCALALQKLRDIEPFVDQFLTYDLLAIKWLPYAKLYPFLEALAGILMIAGTLGFISIPIAFFIGGIGIVSVIKAVYIDKRELRCACIGGNSNVPLGFVSLTENVMMVLMALWMLVK